MALQSLALFLALALQAGGIVTSLNPSNLVAAVKDGGLVILSVSGTITLTNTLFITNNTTIDGTGQNVIISGNQSSRVFHVTNGVTLVLRSVIIANGRATNGGGIYNAGGTVQIINSVLSGHQAVGKSGLPGAPGNRDNNDGGNGTVGTDGFGGAIYNLGMIEIDHSLLTNNLATGGNGGGGGNGFTDSSFGGNGGTGANGGRGFGGGIYSTGSVYIINSTLTANLARGGDGGSNGLGAAAIASGRNGTGGTGSSGQGGAIYSLGLVTITNSVLYSNNAQGGTSGDAGFNVAGIAGGSATGGAIFSRGTVYLGNSTLALNEAKGGSGGRGGDVSVPFFGKTGGNGGAASAGGLYSTNVALLFQSTFGSNVVTGGLPGLGGGPNVGATGATGAIAGANITRASGVVQLKQSIVAEATGAQNVSGGLTDGGLNISSDASYTLVAGLGSRNSTNPRLLPFGNFSGPTLIMGLATNSPAIDAITNVSLAPFTDQRGIPRPQGPRADIGAYEATPLFTISGRVLEGTNGIPEYLVKAATTSAKSSTNGNFSLINLLAGTYVVVPSQIGAGVTPIQTVVTVGPSATNILFRANPPFLQLSLTNVALGASSNSFTRSALIRVAGMPLQTYRIQGLTNLNRTNWLTLTTNSAATNGNFAVFDTTVTNNPQRFYRVIKP